MDKFSALAEPTRRQILELLASQGQLPAGAIYERFPVSRPAISQHLRILREARLVRAEKRAQQRIYRLNPEALAEFEEWARQMRELWDARFDALEKVLEAEKAKLLEEKERKNGRGKAGNPRTDDHARL